MNSLILAYPKKTMARDQAVLRNYARLVTLQRESLPPKEEQERTHRMGEYLAMGRSFALTHKESIIALYRGLFMIKLGCGCPECRARALA